MIKNEIYHYDETECTVEDATDWIEMKQIDITKDPFNYNFVRLTFDITLKTQIDKQGEAAIFIDDEEAPRAVIKNTTPFQKPERIEIDTYNIPYGKHTITLALKGTITNTQLKIGVLRIMTLWEIAGLLTPIIAYGELT